ncbi:MAG: Maf family protein [Verrucomicrobia bacterium]|nr:Maf family protein [Verrucomicrobiota bacterium]
MKIVLASASPRRRQLLEEAGYQVTCIVSGAEEIEDHSFSPAELALENAARKAGIVAGNSPEDTVIAADTVVWKGGRFFGKPSDMEDAFRMLKELVGHTHEVVTGVAIHFPGGKITTFAESSLVTFHELSDDGIRRYLASIHPLDKAGAYAAQDDDGSIIKMIEGSVTNVIGLPVERVREMLGL